MLNRRKLLSGAVAALASPYLCRGASANTAYPPNTVHLVTAIDNSGSMTSFQRQNLQDLAYVLENDLPDILAKSAYDQIRFQIYLWSSFCSSVVSPIQFNYRQGQAPLTAAANTLRAISNGKCSGSTMLFSCLIYGLSQFTVPASRKVLNIVTDDDQGRTDPWFLTFYKPRAEAQNIITNGLILGSPDALDGYFPKYIQSGPGSFTKTTFKLPDVRQAWREKFILDLF